MPRTPDFILRISIRNIEDFSPATIAKSPRLFSAMDVRNACRNVSLEAAKETPVLVQSIAHYIAIDFFALAHNSGLYNRQSRLWESLSKISSIEVKQIARGLFSQVKLPEFDFAFQDHKNRTIALAHFAKPVDSGKRYDYLKSTVQFLKRAAESQGARGIFLCYQSPFPKQVLEFIRQETNATDTIARYESILPKLGASINLLEIESSPAFDPSKQCEFQKIRLIHPDLGKRKLGGDPIVTADMNALDNQRESEHDPQPNNQENEPG